MYSKIISNETVHVLTIQWCAVMLLYYIRDCQSHFKIIYIYMYTVNETCLKHYISV